MFLGPMDGTASFHPGAEDRTNQEGNRKNKGRNTLLSKNIIVKTPLYLLYAEIYSLLYQKK